MNKKSPYVGNTDTIEQRRRKREEEQRNGRRFRRQLLGFFLCILMLVGAGTIVVNSAHWAASLLDNSSEIDEYKKRVAPFVWLDCPPFESVSAVSSNTLRAVCLWGAYSQNKADDTVLTTEDGSNTIIPTSDLDRYAAGLFGPDFKFSSHETFTGVDGGIFEFDTALNAYILPMSLEQQYDAQVESVKRISNGRKIITGYIPTTSADGGVMLPSLEGEPPSFYREFIFERDGNNFYLKALRTSDYVSTSSTSSSSSSSSSTVSNSLSSSASTAVSEPTGEEANNDVSGIPDAVAPTEDANAETTTP